MAKMFYTLEETAEALGVDPEKVRELAGEGRLQQFRDRDKLMFKRDQVDAMVSTQEQEAEAEADVIPLSDTGMGDQIDLAAETASGGTAAGRTGSQAPGADDTKTGTGVNVFESGEMELADPAAQTHVTESSSMDDEALALESVGSGSGLLDLTRESDDTSLGAELLDEIYPSDDSQAGASALGASALAESALGGSAMDGSGLGSGMGSAALEGAAAELEGSSIGSGLEAIPEPSGLSGLAGAPAVAVVAEVQDPAWSGALAGVLLGVTIVLMIALAIAAGAVVGAPTGITAAIAGSLWMYVGIMLGGCALLGLVGMFIGKMGG